MTFLGKKSVKNGQLYHFLDVRKSQERQARKKFYNKINVPKILDLKSSYRTNIFRKLTLGAPDRISYWNSVMIIFLILYFSGTMIPQLHTLSITYYVFFLSNLGEAMFHIPLRSGAG